MRKNRVRVDAVKGGYRRDIVDELGGREEGREGGREGGREKERGATGSSGSSFGGEERGVISACLVYDLGRK